MIDSLFIFGAKYLYLLSILLGALLFFKFEISEKKKMIAFALISLGLALLLSIILRETYFNPRPFVVGGFEPLIPHEADNGFPSDHTLLVAAVASVFSFFHKRGALWLWLITGIVGISRVYVGVHHFVDILGSILIALTSAYIAYAIMQKLWNKNRNTVCL